MALTATSVPGRGAVQRFLRTAPIALPPPNQPMMTGVQGNLILNGLDAALRRLRLPESATQIVLDEEYRALIAELMAIVRKRVDTHSGEILVRHVLVDRRRSLEEAFAATGIATGRQVSLWQLEPHNALEGGECVVKQHAGPVPGPEETEAVEIVLFRPDRNLDDIELSSEYACRSLRPVDPYALAALYELDPLFGPAATHWQDAKKRWWSAWFPDANGLISIQQSATTYFSRDYGEGQLCGGVRI